MKKIKIITFLLVIYSFAPAQDMPGMDMHKKETKPSSTITTYTCPMHPEIHSSNPGKCPKCGMKLIKEKSKDSQKSLKVSTNEKSMDMGNMPMSDMEICPRKKLT